MDYSAEAFFGGLPPSLMRFGPFVGPLLLFLMGFMWKIVFSHFSQLLLLEEFCNESFFFAIDWLFLHIMGFSHQAWGFVCWPMILKNGHPHQLSYRAS